MKKLWVLFSLTMLVLAGCGGGGSDSAANSAANIGGGSNSAANPAGNGTIKVLASIAVSPSDSRVAVGATTQFAATGTYADGTTEDITATVTWSSSNQSIATISNDASSKGRATTVAAGTTNITAVSGSITDSTPFSAVVLNPATDVLIGGYQHIGDGIWAGEVNSQFAYPTTGKTYIDTFTLLAQPQQFPYAIVTFTHKGIEVGSGYKDILMINSHAIPLNDSNADGSFTTFSSGKLPSNWFLPNQDNTISFESGNITWNLLDFDDFEFQNILVQFSN